MADNHHQHRAPRIVSLISSASEIVCALGWQGHLVGRSHECDFPDEIQSLPICSRPRIDITRSSAGIHQQINTIWRASRESNQDAGSLNPGSPGKRGSPGNQGEPGERGGQGITEAVSIYDIDIQLLDQLQPDIIITQSQCRVCAVSLADVQRAVCDMIGSQPRIISCEPTGLEDVFDDIEKISEAIGDAARGKELIGRMRQRMQLVARGATRHVKQQVKQIEARPTIAYIEWIDPLMVGGNWMPSLIKMAGGKDLFGLPDRPSPKIKWQDLIDGDPDVLVICPCGFNLARTRAELCDLIDRPGWRDLKAVRTQRAYLADGHQYFNRPGPRLVDSLEMLAEMFHPGSFDFGHRAKGWLPL